MASFPLSSRAVRFLPFALILGFVLIAYHNSFSAPFLFDDHRNIVKSEVIQNYWDPSGEVGLDRKIYSRPVTSLSYAVNFALGGLSVWHYHIFNLIVHLGTAFLLFLIIRAMLLTERMYSQYGDVADWMALACALLWAVHPVQTQSVTYIVQRAESMMGFFYLFTLYSVIRSAKRGSRFWPVLAVVSCFLGMGCKQVMVTAPIMVLIFDRIFLEKSFRDVFNKRKGVYAGLAAGWIFLAVLVWNDARLNAQPSAGFGLEQITAWDYALSQPAVILHYLKLAFWPQPLVFDYLWPVASPGFFDFWLPMIFLLALLAGILAAFRWNAPLAYWGLWFFMILAPTSSMMPIGDLAVEHRMYLPLAGILVLAVAGIYEILLFLVHRRVLNAKVLILTAFFLMFSAASAFAWLTVQRNTDYQSEASLWQDTIRKRPNNFRAYTALGNALIKAGKFNQAEEPFTQALKIKPDSAITHYNFALALVKIGRVEDSLRHYETAVRMDETLVHPGYHTLMGDVFRALGRREESVRQYRRAVELKPGDANAQFGMAILHAETGQVEEAVRYYQRTLELDPRHARAHNNLGTLLVQKGQIVEALRHFVEAIKIDPEYQTAQQNFMVLNQQLEKLRQQQNA